jgi:UDP-glucose-4-epimerase GalE
VLKALVAGGAGYVGSHVVRELRDAGHRVTVLDDLSQGHRAALPQDVGFVEADLADAAALARALEGAEVVLHFAARLSVGESVARPDLYYGTNLGKGLALLAGMRAAGVGKIVFSSTCATYGMPVRVPMDEGHPQDPVNPYGSTKLAFERALRDMATAGQLHAVALRYFNAAGGHPDGSLGEDHRPEEHLIPRAIDAALGRGPGLTIFGDDYDTPDGTCLRDYIHVSDLARAHVLALAVLEGPGFRAYNLGTERGHSVREVAACVEEVTGRPVPRTVGPRRAGDPPRLLAAAGLARRELSFVPRHLELGEIVESALRWRRDHPEGYAG